MACIWLPERLHKIKSANNIIRGEFGQEQNKMINVQVAVNYSAISQSRSGRHLAFPKYNYFLWCKMVTRSLWPGFGCLVAL